MAACRLLPGRVGAPWPAVSSPVPSCPPSVCRRSHGYLTFDEWQLAFGREEGVEADVLRALVDEFDADQDGCVSIAQFQAGLASRRCGNWRPDST